MGRRRVEVRWGRDGVISAEKVIPEEIQMRLMHLGQLGDEAAWEIGDIGIELEAAYPEIQKQEIYSMMGQYCGRTGSTVRDHVRISRAVNDSIRVEFDMLCRNHWRAMLPHCDTDEELVAMASWWLQQADDYGGKIGSVAALRYALQEDGPPRWERRVIRIARGCRLVAEDKAAPHEIREYCNDFVGQLGPWVSSSD